MEKGRVKWFDPVRGYGFLINENGPDIFVHYSGIEQEGFRSLKSGQMVVYELRHTAKGLQGWKVRVVCESERSEGGTAAEEEEAERA